MSIDGLLNNPELDDDGSLSGLMRVLLDDNSRDGQLVLRNLSIYKTIHQNL